MLAKFDKEHTHSEDEVRFILAGRGIFFLNIGSKVASVEVGPGDMLRVPRGTTHWFTLCEDRRIRAIRWFQQTSGWTPQYTESGIDKNYQPLCFGPTYMGPRVETVSSERHDAEIYRSCSCWILRARLRRCRWCMSSCFRMRGRTSSAICKRTLVSPAMVNDLTVSGGGERERDRRGRAELYESGILG